MYYLAIAGLKRPPEAAFIEAAAGGKIREPQIQPIEDRIFLVTADNDDQAVEQLALKAGLERKYLLCPLKGFEVNVRATAIVEPDPPPAPSSPPASSTGTTEPPPAASAVAGQPPKAA